MKDGCRPKRSKRYGGHFFWAANEFQALDLGDGRLNARTASLAARLLEHPTSSLLRACRGWAETKAACRLLPRLLTRLSIGVGFAAVFTYRPQVIRPDGSSTWGRAARD